MKRINLFEGDINNHIALGLKAIRDGYIICAPAEHGYLLLADAFSEFAVRAMHVKRGDPLGVAAQVLIHSGEAINGIARDLTEETRSLMDAFWPGLISFNVRPQRGLRWDLGDDNTLDRLSVRVPESPFIAALLKESGPLAVASAAPAGEKPLLKLDSTSEFESELALIFDGGELAQGPATTVIESDSRAMTIIREGAISRAQLAAVVPALSSEKPIG